MSSLRGKRVFVTGASGYLGQSLVPRLVNEGCEVIAQSRRALPDTINGVRNIRLDLEDERATGECIADVRPEIVYHLSGFVDGRQDPELVVPQVRANTLATAVLLSACLRQGCDRFVFASSMEEPAQETPKPAPGSVYSLTQWASSHLVRMYHRLYDFPVVLLRTFYTYGPGHQPGTKLIPYIIGELLEKRPPELSSGRRGIDFVFIEDVVDAYVKAATGDRVTGLTVDVGSGSLISIADLANTIADIVGNGVRPKLGQRADRKTEVSPVADVKDSFEHLGWRPRVSLAEGMKKTIDWHRKRLSVGTDM